MLHLLDRQIEIVTRPLRHARRGERTALRRSLHALRDLLRDLEVEAGVAVQILDEVRSMLDQSGALQRPKPAETARAVILDVLQAHEETAELVNAAAVMPPRGAGLAPFHLHNASHGSRMRSMRASLWPAAERRVVMHHAAGVPRFNPVSQLRYADSLQRDLGPDGIQGHLRRIGRTDFGPEPPTGGQPARL